MSIADPSLRVRPAIDVKTRPRQSGGLPAYGPGSRPPAIIAGLSAADLGASGLSFVVRGAPRTKKTHQRIARRRDGSPFIMSAKTSIGWEQSAILQLRAQARDQSVNWHRGGVVVMPVNCRALIYRDRAAGDAVNYYQAVADALEGAGVVENDRLIVAWDGSRLLKDAKNPRVEITLSPLED